MEPGKPLDGIRIVELSSVVTAALATQLLTEQGASTVKVEPLGIGDTLRHLGTSREGVAAAFVNCNRGKQSIALDLKTPAGLEIVRRLAARADVLISNYRPGVLERLGLGSETLRQSNPQLIYVAVSGFGTDGPLATAPAYDHVIQALTGFTALQGGTGPREFMRTFVCDEVTAYTASQAITAALFQRSRSGEGQHIDISMLEAALYFLWPAGFMDHTYVGDDVARKTPLRETYRAYRTADGYVGMAPFTDAHWHGLLRATGREAMLDDPRFATMAGRSRHLPTLMDEFADAFADISTADTLTLLAELDVPCSACLSLEAVAQHEQVRAVGAVQSQEHPLLGRLRSPAHPVRFGGRQYPAAPAPGGLGAHSRQVLEELNFPAQQIEQWLSAGVVAEPTPGA